MFTFMNTFGDLRSDDRGHLRVAEKDRTGRRGKNAGDQLEHRRLAGAAGATILAAGRNFGCGSSREHAVWAIRGAGVQTVVAKSFARIFYRNAINCGFYLIESAQAPEHINDGDEVEIDYKAGLIRNRTTSAEVHFEPLPNFALEIIKDGGLLNHITKKLGQPAGGP